MATDAPTDIMDMLGTFMAPREAKPPVASYSSVVLSLGGDEVSHAAADVSFPLLTRYPSPTQPADRLLRHRHTPRVW